MGSNIEILTINTFLDTRATSVLVINQLSAANYGNYRCIANDTIYKKVLTSSAVAISVGKLHKFNLCLMLMNYVCIT